MSAPCRTPCTDAASEALNRECVCEAADVSSARAAVLAQMAAGDVSARYGSLFSPYALFVDRASLEAMAAVARAVFEVSRHPGYRACVLSWAQGRSWRDPGSNGGVLGFDFHLTAAGPRLIEINTNPGGLLLNADLLGHVEACTPGTWQPPAAAGTVRARAVDAWLDDLAAQAGGRRPGRLAIVDEAPAEQFLAPEFELYARAFRERGVDAFIASPESLAFTEGGLVGPGGRIDAVYNRLTDFDLRTPAVRAIALAYDAGAVALSPHPFAHALFADKRNLAVLGDGARLSDWGIARATVETLSAAIPATVAITPANRDALWQDRDRYFFKPATGYGSRGTYRGDKLTRKTWEAMAGSDYVAQLFAPPSLRLQRDGTALKVDVRCFATAEGGVIVYAARLYQGQATNLRTPGGGFAAVLTRGDAVD